MSEVKNRDVPSWIVDAPDLFNSEIKDCQNPIEVVRKASYDQLQTELAKKDELIKSLENQVFGSSKHAEIMERKATLANKLLRKRDALL